MIRGTREILVHKATSPRCYQCVTEDDVFLALGVYRNKFFSEDSLNPDWYTPCRCSGDAHHLVASPALEANPQMDPTARFMTHINSEYIQRLDESEILFERLAEAWTELDSLRSELGGPELVVLDRSAQSPPRKKAFYRSASTNIVP